MTQEQYNTLEERIDKIHDYLNIDGKRMQLVEYKLRSADPNIYKPENEKNRDFIFGEIKELNKVLFIYDDMKKIDVFNDAGNKSVIFTTSKQIICRTMFYGISVDEIYKIMEESADALAQF